MKVCFSTLVGFNGFMLTEPNLDAKTNNSVKNVTKQCFKNLSSFQPGHGARTP